RGSEEESSEEHKMKGDSRRACVQESKRDDIHRCASSFSLDDSGTAFARSESRKSFRTRSPHCRACRPDSSFKRLTTSPPQPGAWANASISSAEKSARPCVWN